MTSGEMFNEMDARLRALEVAAELISDGESGGGDAPSILVEDITGDDTLYSGGGLTVQGILDDGASVPTEVPTETPAAPYPANLGEGTVDGAQVWVATRISVGGDLKTSNIGSVPDDSLCESAQQVTVPVTGGGGTTTTVYVLSIFL